MENIITQGEGTIRAHLEHLRAHGEHQYLKIALDCLRERNLPIPTAPDKKQAPCACPGAQARTMGADKKAVSGQPTSSCLANWPIQLALAPVRGSSYQQADLLLAADCTAFACGGFHGQVMKGKVTLIACPKLDKDNDYEEKLADILTSNDVRSLTCAVMEVPCCAGLTAIAERAVAKSGRPVAVKKITVKIDGSLDS